MCRKDSTKFSSSNWDPYGQGFLNQTRGKGGWGKAGTRPRMKEACIVWLFSRFVSEVDLARPSLLW